MSLSYYIIYLIVIATGFLAGLLSLKSKRPVWSVIILLGVTLCSETVSKILSYTGNNAVVYHIYQPVQTILWGVFFYNNLRQNSRKTVIPLSALLVLFSVLNTVYLQHLHTFPGNFIKLESVFLLFLGINLFIEFLDRPAHEQIFANSVFIISIAVIWFNLISYFFFMPFNTYVQRKIPTGTIRSIHYLSNIVYYLLLAYAMTIKTKFYEER